MIRFKWKTCLFGSPVCLAMEDFSDELIMLRPGRQARSSVSLFIPLDGFSVCCIMPELCFCLCPSDKECGTVLDIAFIVDSSGSIGRKNWERMKRFVKSIVSKLDVGRATTRVAAIAYSTNPEVVWRFSDFQGTDMVNRIIDRMRWQRDYTYTDKALLLADRDLFQTSNGMRLNAQKVSN